MQDKMTVSAFRRGRIFDEGRVGLSLWGCQHADALSWVYVIGVLVEISFSLLRTPGFESEDMEKSVDTATSNKDDINSKDK